MKQMRLVLALAAGVLSTGCFQMATTVTVKEDGSGTIAQRLQVTRAAFAQLQQLTVMGGDNGKPLDLLSEEQARAAAAKLGSGVTYVTSTPIDDAAGLGRETLYAFTDIGQLLVDQRPPMPGEAGIQADGLDAAKRNIAFAMAKLPNGNSVLTITMPKPDFNSGPLRLAGGRQDQASSGQAAMMKQMFAGARLTIAVQPAGTLVRSSSPYVTGNQVTLVDIDFSQLIDNPALDRLRSATTAEELKTAMKDVPGVKMDLEPQLTIEFTPAK